MSEKPSNEMIERFISQFSDISDAFLCGKCYWFSVILKERFDGVIYYEPIYNHFITKVGNEFYDARGNVTDIYKDSQNIYVWSEYQEMEPVQSARITRDCIEYRTVTWEDLMECTNSLKRKKNARKNN